MTQIFRERFINLKTRGTGINYCWNYRPSELLRHFIAYRLDQLNNKHTKIAVNSAIQYFEGHSQKKCLLKVWPLNFFFAKLNGKHLLRWNKMHFFSIFQGLSVARNYLRPEIAPSTLLAVKIGRKKLFRKKFWRPPFYGTKQHMLKILNYYRIINLQNFVCTVFWKICQKYLFWI